MSGANCKLLLFICLPMSYSIPLHNTGKVALRYQWAVVLGDDDDAMGYSGSQLLLPESLYAALLRPESRRRELPSFFIAPTEGTVLPGETVNFKVTFRPIIPGVATLTMMCR